MLYQEVGKPTFARPEGSVVHVSSKLYVDRRRLPGLGRPILGAGSYLQFRKITFSAGS